MLSGPAWSARPTSTKLARGGRLPAAAGRDRARCRAHEIASALTGRRSTAALPRGRPLGPCLSFCLIHPRPGPFTDVHPDRVCAVRGRWRTPVNAGQHCWKACWGNPSRVRISYPPPCWPARTSVSDRYQAGSSCPVGSFDGLISPAVEPAAADISRCGGPGRRHHGRP